MTFTKTLKENWIGGIIGFIGSSFLMTAMDPIQTIIKFFTYWGPFGDLGFLLLMSKFILVGGYIIGAYIQ